MKKLFFLFSLLFVALTSCNKDDNNDPIIDPTSAKIIVLNEGGYTYGNSSLSTISFNDVLANNVFETVNNKPLGDVGQSICYSGGKYYIAMNNSRKVQVISAEDYKLIETISIDDAGTIPMYMAEVSSDRIVLSDSGESVLHLIDSKTNKIIKKIALPGYGSKMIVTNNKLFVNIGNSIVVFDINNLDAAARTIDVETLKSARFSLDKNGDIWALSNKSLIKINPTSETTTSVTLPTDISIDAWGARLSIDKLGSKLYFNGQSSDYKPIIYQMDITETTPKLLFKAENVKMLYNMEVTPDNKIAICDALDFVQNGYLYTYNLDGTKDKEYNVGIIPQFILFTEYNKN